MSKSTVEILRQRRAATGFLTADESFVYTTLARRAAGLTRQKTTEEIAAMYCAEHQAWKCAQH